MSGVGAPRADQITSTPGLGRLGGVLAGLRPRPATLWGYLFISPWLLGFALFYLIPLGAIVAFSFTRYSLLGSPRWIGADNYTRMIEDERFWAALYNTAYYVALRVPIHVLLAFALALLVNRRARGMHLARTVLYLPTVVPVVATAAVWGWILHPRLGIMRFALEALGLPAPIWLASEVWAKPAIVVMSLWPLGAMMVIFLAGLQDIPEHLYEAAEIDGAGPLRRLLVITVPMMTPVFLFNLILDLINSFQVFAIAFILTKGGPLESTLFYVLYIFKNAFEYFEMGYASALSVVLFLVTFGFTMLVFRTSNRWVHYERV
jgi:multiple sugar transport system permease protein